MRIETRGLYAVLALAALAIGLLVYVFERDPRRVMLLGSFFASPPAHGSSAGPLAGWLPAFVHVYAFILLSAAVTRPWRTRAAWLSLAWWLTESAFECLQHPILARPVAEWWGANLGSIPGADIVLGYLRRGTFDLGDLAAIALGALAAYLTLVLSESTRERRHA